MKRSGQAMDSGDVRLAMSLSKDAARAYHKALADRRYRTAMAVQKELQEALKAKETEKIERMDNMLERAEKIRDAAVRRANALKEHITPSTILQTSDHEMPAKDKLSAQIKLLMKNQKLIGIKPTQLDEDQSDSSQPVPKVLDCGPLANDCNTKQGGEYYIHKQGKTQQDQPQASKSETSEAKADGSRVSMLSATSRRPKSFFSGFKLLKHVSAAERQHQREALLSPKTSQGNSDQFLKSLATGFLTPRAHTSSKGMRAMRGQELYEGSKKLSVLAQMNDLDVEQAKLNKQREDLIRSHLSSAKDHTILVDRMVMQWVPRGMLAIPSSLSFTPVDASEKSNVKAEDANKIRVAASGVSLEEALGEVNKQQVAINKNRLVLMQQIHTSNPNTLIEEAAKAGEAVPVLVQLPSTPEDKAKDLKRKLFKNHFDEATKAFEAANSAFKVAAKGGAANPVVGKTEVSKESHKAETVAAVPVAAAAPAAVKKSHVVQSALPQEPKKVQTEEKKPEEEHAAKSAESIKKSSKAEETQEKKKGLVTYDAVKAAQDLTGFFDDLIAKRVAVGGGHKSSQAEKTHKHQLSGLELERKKEDDLISKQEQEDISVAQLEKERQYVIKSGQPAAYVGNELKHKSAEESRKELNDFYNSLSH